MSAPIGTTPWRQNLLPGARSQHRRQTNIAISTSKLGTTSQRSFSCTAFHLTQKTGSSRSSTFSSRGYGIVAPDLLGYAESSTPEDLKLYRLRSMSREAIELLDHLEVSTAVGVGHDFGSTLLSRLAAYYPERWSALVLLAVGPPKLGTPFDVQNINKMTKEMLGYELLGYIPWLGGDGGADEILEKHAESAMSLLFTAAEEETWKRWFRPLGKMRQFVTGDRRVDVGEWYPEALREKHLRAFGKPGGYKGAANWYRMWKENLFAEDEQGYEDFRFDRPVLFVVPSSDAGQQESMLAGWAADVKVVRFDSGHWIHLERKQETNEAIDAFVNAAEVRS